MGDDVIIGSDREDRTLKERHVERKLVQTVREKGGMCPKWVSPGLSGVPDRIVLLPGGRIAFVEVKRPGGKMRPLQLKRKRQIEVLGFRVFCLDNVDQVGEVLDEIENQV